MLRAKISIRRIAKALKRSSSTIFREIKRNSCKIGDGRGYFRYYPIYAEKQYQIRREKCHRYTEYTDRHAEYIENKIKLHGSPEQIAEKQQTKIAKLPPTSTIYGMMHNGKIEKIRMCHLRRKGKFKGHKYRQGRFDDESRSIGMKAKNIYKREEVGYW